MAAGEINIELGGETVVLKATVGAFITIPERFDGFVGAFRALAKVDVSACAFMVAVGKGNLKPSKKDLETIVEQLFDAGLEQPLTLLTEYLSLLSAGGAKRAEAQSDAAGE